jgi:hypothetical protein
MSNVCQIFLLLTIDTLDNMGYTLDILDTNIEHKAMEAIMETASATSTGKHTFLRHDCSPAFRHGTTSCPRCGGLMVGEYCMDLPNGTGELEFLASRCVQCGEVVDPVILKNRSIQQQRRPPHSLDQPTTLNESIQQGGTL